MKRVLALATLVCLFGGTASTAQETATIPANGTRIHLWENGAPGFEDKKDEEEVAEQWWVANVHNPSITAFFPEEGKANGTAVLIAPGGGHGELVFDEEGTKAAKFLNQHGVIGFALKYRLSRDKLLERADRYPRDSAQQDAHRAMRYIRSHAAEWGINPDRIGIMGFSAGGEVAHRVAFSDNAGDENAADPIDKISSKPNFLIDIYPGGAGVPRGEVPADSPPAFLLATMEDWGHARPCIELLQKYQAKGIAVELHIFNQGAHGYNMGDRSSLKTIKGWPDRMADWMQDSGLLEAAE